MNTNLVSLATVIPGAKPIHHATLKRAARLGVELVQTPDGGFQLTELSTGNVSDTYDSTAEALEEMERGEVEFNEPEDDETKLSGSVVRKRYHDQYSKNPHGPGCNDGLDCALRDATTYTPEGSKEPKIDLVLLRQVGQSAGLWVGEWETLNPGMQRMNLSNRLRAYLRNGEDRTISVGGTSSRFGVEFSPAKSKRRKAAK